MKQSNKSAKPTRKKSEGQKGAPSPEVDLGRLDALTDTLLKVSKVELEKRIADERTRKETSV